MINLAVLMRFYYGLKLWLIDWSSELMMRLLGILERNRKTVLEQWDNARTLADDRATI